MRFDPPRNNPHVPWFYKNESCTITGIESNFGIVQGIYLKVASKVGEIVISPDEDGNYGPDLTYGSN